MISLRLTRIGKKKRPLYRLIAVPKHNDPWGKNLEILGNVDPRTKVNTLKVERIKYWLSVGAQPSNTVHNLLVSEGVIEGKKVGVTSLTKKRRGKMEAKVKTDAETKIKAEEAIKAKAEKEKADAEAAKLAEAEATKKATEAEAEAPAEATPETSTEPAPEAPTEPQA